MCPKIERKIFFRIISLMKLKNHFTAKINYIRNGRLITIYRINSNSKHYAPLVNSIFDEISKISGGLLSRRLQKTQVDFFNFCRLKVEIWGVPARFYLKIKPQQREEVSVTFSLISLRKFS